MVGGVLVAVFPSNVEFFFWGRGGGGWWWSVHQFFFVEGLYRLHRFLHQFFFFWLLLLLLLKVCAHCIGLCTNFFFAEGLCTSWVLRSMKKIYFTVKHTIGKLFSLYSCWQSNTVKYFTFVNILLRNKRSVNVLTSYIQLALTLSVPYIDLLKFKKKKKAPFSHRRFLR